MLVKTKRFILVIAPEACADLNGSATGGCPEYTYQWSDENGNTLSSGTSDNVCPSESTV